MGKVLTMQNQYYPCRLCNAKISPTEVVSHYRDEHNETLVVRYYMGDNVCEVCGDDVPRDYKALLQHYATEHVGLLDTDEFD